MADNVAITQGSGTSVATDDVSGVHFQKVKLDLGGDGVSAPVSGSVPVNDNSGSLTVDDGGSSISVDDGAGSLTVDNGGTFAVQDSEKIADNAAFTDGTSKVMMAGFAFDETAGTALTENDAAAARVDSKRAQVLVIEDETTRGRRATVTASNALKVDPSGVTQPVSGSVNPAPTTSGGLSISRVISAASTNATSVKGSAGQVYAIYVHNINAAVRYLKLYNKATSPTVGTDTPVLTLPIPGNTAGAGFVLDTGGMGIAFATGIALAITTGVADNDTGAVAANEIVVTVLYK